MSETNQVRRRVMPILLDEGQVLQGIIYLDMLREDLAAKHFGKSLQQIADSGGVTPSQMVALKDHRWRVPISSEDTALAILNHCFESPYGWATSIK